MKRVFIKESCCLECRNQWREALTHEMFDRESEVYNHFKENESENHFELSNITSRCPFCDRYTSHMFFYTIQQDSIKY